MKVKDLIEELKKYPDDMPVMKAGYEGGYKDVFIPVEKDNILLNVNTEWYYGPHESEDSELFNKTKAEGKEKVKALII